jgi:hypothetical protein
MSGRLMLRQAASELRPCQQGELDRLCGLYATINCIQLALFPYRRLTEAHRRRLFSVGIGFLHKNKLLRSIIDDGMPNSVLVRLRVLLAEEAGVIAGRRIRLLQLPPDLLSIKDVLRQVRLALRRGDPVMITLWGRYDHTTVVFAFSKQRLFLFDSHGFRWIELRTLGLISPSSMLRHQVRAQEVLIFSA